MWVDHEKYLDFIDGLIDKAKANVSDYEHFHGERLAHIPSMHPMDSFLYGVASGKLDQLVYLRSLFEALEETEGG